MEWCRSTRTRPLLSFQLRCFSGSRTSFTFPRATFLLGLGLLLAGIVGGGNSMKVFESLQPGAEFALGQLVVDLANGDCFGELSHTDRRGTGTEGSLVRSRVFGLQCRLRLGNNGRQLLLRHLLLNGKCGACRETAEVPGLETAPNADERDGAPDVRLHTFG